MDYTAPTTDNASLTTHSLAHSLTHSLTPHFHSLILNALKRARLETGGRGSGDDGAVTGKHPSSNPQKLTG